MVEANVKITKDIHLKGLRIASRYSGIINIIQYYGVRLFILWIIISYVDDRHGQPELIGFHFKSLFIVWIIVSMLHCVYWYVSGIKKSARDYSFYASLNEDGVTTQYPKEFLSWSSYHSIKEYRDLYLIKGTNGTTFLPKDENISEVIKMSKKYIKKAKS